MKRLLAVAIGAISVAGAGTPATAALVPSYHLVDSIVAPDGPWDYVRIDGIHNRLFMPRGAAVMEVDLATSKITTGLAAGGRQHIALPVNGGREILVTNGVNDSAIFADANTGAIIATLPTGKGPDAAGFDPRSKLVLVIGHAGGDVTLIDPEAHKVVGTIAVGGTLEEVATDGAGHAFVNVESKNEIAVIDITQRKVISHWAMAGCEGPTGLAYDRQDKLLIASCDGITALVRATDGKLVDALPTGRGADGVSYDEKRHLAFVPAGRDGTLAVIEFAAGRGHIAQKVATQLGARTIAEDERTGRVYLPSAQYGPPPAAGGRPSIVPGSFRVLVLAP